MSGSLHTMIRDLGRRKGRERRGLTLAEGVRLVEEALAMDVPFKGVAVAPTLEGTTRGRALKAELTRRGVRLEEVTDADLSELGDTEHPQGVIAVIEPRAWALASIPVAPGAVVLVMDAVQDPGNVGTMLRTAHALGAAGVIALKGTAELANPKVLRGSMGAAFRLPAVAADAPELLAWAASAGVELWAAAADGEPLGKRGTSGKPLAIIVGNEGAGIGEVLMAAAARRVAIPIRADAESLNVAVAAGILLYEVMRGH